MASNVVLSALCVPIQESAPEDVYDYDVQKEKLSNMATLLNFPETMSRATLLNDVYHCCLLL